MSESNKIVYRCVTLLIVLSQLGCGESKPSTAEVTQSRSTIEAPSANSPLSREMPGLHNVHRVTEKLVSGSSPEGKKGFQSLAELGVKTIVSVDGAKPEVALAAQHGMRYVHLPIGYDGITRPRVLQLAKAVRDLPGQVYVHCHHGKHRGPAAALAIRLCLDDSCSLAEALAEMKRLGTDPRYQGLFNVPRELVRPTSQELDDLPADFSETSNVAPLTKWMVAIDVQAEHLKRIRSAGWKTPKDDPDLEPAHESLLLVEHYRETARLPEITTYPQAFAQALRDAEKHAADLERALRDSKRGNNLDLRRVESAYQKVRQSCTHCHEQHRDNPPPD